MTNMRYVLNSFVAVDRHEPETEGTNLGVKKQTNKLVKGHLVNWC